MTGDSSASGRLVIAEVEPPRGPESMPFPPRRSRLAHLFCSPARSKRVGFTKNLFTGPEPLALLLNRANARKTKEALKYLQTKGLFGLPRPENEAEKT
jgi:hypothetical protein